MPTHQILLILIIAAFLQSRTAFSESQTKPPICIKTETGWTLAIWQDGRASLARTDSQNIRASTSSAQFDYNAVITSVKKASCSEGGSRLEFYFGQFDKPDVKGLSESASIHRLLQQAQIVFEPSTEAGFRKALSNSPLLESDQ